MPKHALTCTSDVPDQALSVVDGASDALVRTHTRNNWLTLIYAAPALAS